MNSISKKQRGTLVVGLLLVAAGLIFFLFPSGVGLAEWLMRLWPIFLICAGVVRVMGFAVERKPKSPTGGMLLMIIGLLFFVGRFHSDLNALQIYGRYWILLLAVFAGVELIRFYSHRHTEGPPPRMFTARRLIVILLIATTGIFANRVAGSNSSLLSALKLDGFIGGLRDSVVGDTYSFTDGAVTAQPVNGSIKVTVNNSYGNVKVSRGGLVRATLTKGVRAWNESDARRIAEQIKLSFTQTSEGVSISTNRSEVNHQFTTDILIEVPQDSYVAVTNSYGAVTAEGLSSDLMIKESYGRADVSGIDGDVSLALNYSDVNISRIGGDLSVTGAKQARITSVAGSVEVAASNGSVHLQDIAGKLKVEAPFCSIDAQDLRRDAEIKTENGSVKVARTSHVSIKGPRSDVRAEQIDGDLFIDSSHSQVVVRDVAGEMVVAGEKSSITAENVHGPVEVETSHGEVTVKNFYEAVRVATSYRDVILITSNPPSSDIEVENSHGGIKLVLPQASQFQLDATSESGQVRPVGFAELGGRTRGENLFAILGSDGPVIRLKTSYKNITVQANGSAPTQASKVVE